MKRDFLVFEVFSLVVPSNQKDLEDDKDFDFGNKQIDFNDSQILAIQN